MIRSWERSATGWSGRGGEAGGCDGVAVRCSGPSIADLYDAWWDKRAPGRTRLERAAATAARKHAIAGNWCAAAALDDDLLDTPGYRPRQGWKPATGTGIAPDIYPPASQHRNHP